MILFCNLSPLHQTVLLTALFVTMLLGVFCLGISKYSINRTLCRLTDAVAVFLLFFFTEQCSGTAGDEFPVPAGVLWGTVFCGAVWFVFQTAYGIYRMHHTIGLHSVKYAFDSLPCGICFFNPSGTVKLCNRQMHWIFGELTRGDIQMLSELETALAACDGFGKQTYRFPDGSVWRYQQTEVTTKDGTIYTEALFTDVTMLYAKHRELETKNAQLKEMFRGIGQLSDNALEMTREKEILAAKTNLHEQMGAGVLAIRQSLLQNDFSKENTEMIEHMFAAIDLLKRDNDSTIGRSDLGEFIHNAAMVGIRVEMTGSLPREDHLHRLFLLAMKECCTNAVQHAAASTLWVTVEKEDKVTYLHIENDGKPPEGDVTPRGGLLNLMGQLEKWKGEADIQSAPCFALTIKVPAGGE